MKKILSIILPLFIGVSLFSCAGSKEGCSLGAGEKKFKTFLVLCCYQEKNGVYTYEVREVGNDKVTGTLYHPQKYSEGDTVTFHYASSQEPTKIKK